MPQAPRHSAGPCVSLKPLPNFTFHSAVFAVKAPVAQQNHSAVAALSCMYWALCSVASSDPLISDPPTPPSSSLSLLQTPYSTCKYSASTWILDPGRRGLHHDQRQTRNKRHFPLPLLPLSFFDHRVFPFDPQLEADRRYTLTA